MSALLGLALGASLPGCEPGAPGATTVTDSAGIRMVIATDGPLVFAEVDSLPMLSLGGPEAEGPEVFYRIESVRTDAGGRLWVADGQSQEIRIFEPGGGHWKTVGGRGDGPGEFQQFRFFGARGDGRMVFWDRAAGRLTVFDRDASVDTMIRFSGEDRPIPAGYDVFGDGSILAQFPTYVPADEISAGVILQDTVRLQRLRVEDGSAGPQVEMPGITWVWTGSQQVPLPFMINPAFDLDGDAILVADGASFRVKRFEGSRVTAIFGVERERRPVDPAAISRYRRIWEESDGPWREGYLQVLDHPLRPELLPAYDHVVVDSEGRIWAQLYTVDRSASLWDVYAPDGPWLGRVQAPDRFVVHEIGEDRMIGVWRDELGTEQVRVYGLRFSQGHAPG